MEHVRAIETEYRGFRFRSRLEARWAVFFDALQIPFEYEPEGFEFGDSRYLPDFFLPTLNAWFEVKGNEPDQIEAAKAVRLARVAGKDVFMFCGQLDPSMEGWLWRPLSWWSEPVGYDQRSSQIKDIAKAMGWDGLHNALSKVYGMRFSLNRIHIVIGGGGEAVYERLADAENIKKLRYIARFVIGENDGIEVHIQRHAAAEAEQRIPTGGHCWVQCDGCGAVRIDIATWKSFLCSECHGGKLDGGDARYTPQLMAAYKAARRARFEFGELEQTPITRIHLTQ